MSLFAGSGNNGTEAKSDRLGLPTGTSDPGSGEAGDMYYNTTDQKVKFHNGTSWTNLEAPLTTIIAVGGTISYYTSGNARYAVHSFLSGTTNFEITQLAAGSTSNNIDVLLVGGGGGGGSRGGGGGGGGVITHNFVASSLSTYSMVVGDGGQRGGPGSTAIESCDGRNGDNTTAFGQTAYGGGGGAAFGRGGKPSTASGGGAGRDSGTSGGTAGPQGNPGGTAGPGGCGGASGGGGAGGAAANFNADGGSRSQSSPAAEHGGNGGNGLANSLRTGSSQLYGGGGGGGFSCHSNVTTYSPPGGGAGLGGPGGGGDSANGSGGTRCASKGDDNTGGGGGGGSDTTTCPNTGVNQGQPGGSGIVVVRYVTSPT